MFGWIKKRERFENIKLVTQNKLAAMYLRDFLIASHEAGIADSAALVDALDAIMDDAIAATFAVRQGSLTASIFQAQMQANKALRRLYSEQMAGKKAFAQTFGSVSERIESFDRKFEPNEGWKIFCDHFS